jgi:hypothetical protein
MRLPERKDGTYPQSSVETFMLPEFLKQTAGLDLTYEFAYMVDELGVSAKDYTAPTILLL